MAITVHDSIGREKNAVTYADSVGLGTSTLTGRLNFVAGTTAADGIYFGTDVTFYRSAALTLKTNSALVVDKLGIVTTPPTDTHTSYAHLFISQAGMLMSAGPTSSTFLAHNVYYSSTNWRHLGTAAGSYLEISPLEMAYATSQSVAAGALATFVLKYKLTGTSDGTLRLYDSAGTERIKISANSGSTNAGNGITFGQDTYLYRSGAATIRTDGAFIVSTGSAGLYMTGSISRGSAGTCAAILNNSTHNLYVGPDSAGLSLHLGTNNSTRFAVADTGCYVGASAWADGTGGMDTNKIKVYGSGSGTREGSIINSYDDGNHYLHPEVTYARYLYTDSFTNYSDGSLKKNVKPIAKAAEKLKAIRGVAFDWRTDAPLDGATYGVLAEEVRTVFPELVHETDHGEIEKGTPHPMNGVLGLNTIGLVGPMIAAINELTDRVAELEAA